MVRDEPGLFSVEASFMGFTEKMDLKLDDLLAYQDENVSVITLFDSARVNVNLLVFLINKKVESCLEA